MSPPPAAWAAPRTPRVLHHAGLCVARGLVEGRDLETAAAPVLGPLRSALGRADAAEGLAAILRRCS